MQNCLWRNGDSRYISYFHRDNGALKKLYRPLWKFNGQINKFKYLGGFPANLIRSDSSLK